MRSRCWSLPLATADEGDGMEPLLAEVLAGARAMEPVAPSRLRALPGSGEVQHFAADLRGSYMQPQASVRKKPDYQAHAWAAKFRLAPC